MKTDNASAGLAPASGSDGCRWERSKYPHPKFPKDMRRGTLLPDVIWLRFHTVFRGGMMEEVTGWQSTNPNNQVCRSGGANNQHVT